MGARGHAREVVLQLGRGIVTAINSYALQILGSCSCYREGPHRLPATRKFFLSFIFLIIVFVYFKFVIYLNLIVYLNLNIYFNYILLQHYFDLGEHLASADGDDIVKSIEAYLQKRYDDNKWRHKKMNFTEQGGVEKLDEIKANRPENMSEEDWAEYVNFWIHTLLLLLLLLLLVLLLTTTTTIIHLYNIFYYL